MAGRLVGRISRARRAPWLVVAAFAAVAMVLFLPGRARAADPMLGRANDRLGEAAAVLDRLSAASELAQTMPLSDLAPAGALDLADVFDDAGAGVDSLQDKLDAVGALDSAGDLENALDGLDFTNSDDVALTVGGPGDDDGDDAAEDGEPVVIVTGEVVDIALQVTLTKTVDVPLLFPTSIVDLASNSSGGTFPVTFTLQTSQLQFEYDDSLDGTANEATALRLLRTPEDALVPDGAEPPRVRLSVATEDGGASLGSLDTTLGFSAITVGGTLAFDFGAQLELLDPEAVGGSDGDGRIDGVELSSTALEDLVDGELTDDGDTDAVHAELDIATDLLDDPDDAGTDPDDDVDLTITFDDDSLIDNTDGETTFDPETPAIGDFRNFTTEEALAALMRLVSMLDTVQGTGKLDVSLPFVTGKDNQVDPTAAAHGTFSDVLRVGEPLLEAITDVNGVADDDDDLAEPSDDPANPNAIGSPKFASAQDLVAKLATALGLDPGDVGLVYDPATKRLNYDLNLSGSGQTSSLINFGNLDILSAVQVDTAGTVGLSGSFDVPLSFALDLTQQPTEGTGAPIGSCTDGVDNDNDGHIDADDADNCADAETIEGRVALDVGTTPGSPELTARAGVEATGVGAQARIGMLEAGIADANLTVGSTGGEGGDLASCTDGDDDDGDSLEDMADPDCQAAVSLDLTDTDDGWLTIRELLNSLGADPDNPQANVALATNLDAAVDATVPVAATLGGTDLGGGDITATASFDGELTEAGQLLESVEIDASDLHTSDLFAFSPCDDTEDDDGDGVINDGCDGGPPAEDEPETSSDALFADIVTAVRTVADQFENLGIFPPGTLDAPIPLLGVSFDDLVSVADSLTATADQTAAGAESALGATACTNATDDDFDGIVNDGCPTAGSLPESDCADVANPDLGYTPEPNDDPGEDGVVNDGCQPVKPSLQSLADALGGALQRLLQGVPNSTVTLNDTAIDYDPATKDVAFTLDLQFDYTRATELNLDLGDTLGSLVALDSIANLNMNVGAHLVLGFGVNLTDGTPFMLGNTALDLDAELNGTDLFFEVGVGSLKLSVGQETPTPETGTQCDDDADSDGDGFANDGCPAVPDPEVGDDCGDKADDDGDGQPDDGCGDTDDPAVDTAEAGDQCSGDQNEVDSDEDGTADDGCPPDPPTAAQADGDPEGGADDPACAIDNTASDDNPDGDDLDGAVNDGCPARADRARVFLGGGLDLDLGDASGDEDTHYAFDALSFTGGFSGTDQAGCDGLDVPGSPGTQPKDACAILPLYLDLDGPGGNPPAPVGNATPTSHHIEVAIEDLTDPTNVIVDYDTSQLESFLTSQLVDLLLLSSGLQDLIDVVRGLLESDLLSFSLPLIGGQGATAADIADDLEATVRQAVADALVSGQNPMAGLGTVGDVQAVLDNLSDAIATAVTDAGLTVTANGVVLGCSPGGAPGGAVALCDPTESAFNIVDVRFDQTVGGEVDLFDEQLAFDIGIPGLGLSGDLNPQGTIAWEINFGFGVAKRTGFYFATGGPDPEMAVDLDVRLSSADASDPPGTLEGTFGFLAVTAVDGEPANLCTADTDPDEVCRRADDEIDPRSTLGAHFAVDVRDPDDDGALSFAELTTSPDFADLFAFSFEATADINLHLETGFPGGAGLPKLVGDLHLDWSWAIGTTTMTSDVDALEPGPGSNLTLTIDELGLDVGSYISNFLKPIFNDVKRFTDPLKPVLDTISACIPVLSDLSGSCVSLLTLAETLNNGEYVPDFIFDVIKLVQFVADLPNPEDVPGNLTIPIGGPDRVFGLVGDRLREGELDPSQARDAYAPGSFDNLGNLLDSLNGQPAVQGAGSSELKASGLAAIGVTFPFLQEPAKLLGLLFGQDVDLVVWQPNELSLSFSYSQKFGPIWAVPPVFIELGGSASVHGRFGIGYTTKGFRNALFNDGGPAALLQGLFLVDRHPLEGGPDSNELELRGEIFANAQVSVLIFSAGAQGSIYMTIGIDLNDPNSDGRLEYHEAADIIRSTGNVLCIFNLNGKFGVRISIFAEVDLFFWSERWEMTLADIVLYEFEVTCDPKPDPVLAHAEGTTLFLHIGTRTADRGIPSIGEEVTAETFVVTQNPDGSMTVAALGFTQTFTAQGGGAITHVVGDAAGDDDHITLTDGKTEAGTKVPFSATSDLKGGDNNDELTGGVGANTLDGGPGNDRLSARDQVQSASGAVDTITGGPGNDIIDAGRGADVIDGGAGDDRISAGPGGDTIVGGVDNDNIDGGRSVPAVGTNPAAPDGDDFIWGDNKVDDNDAAGTGNDTIVGGDGNDTIRGGGGADRVDGGFGGDTISAGGPAGATCVDGPVDDVLVGGPDADSISAGAGNDLVVGGNTLGGEPDTGDTSLNGDAGCDSIVGDNGTQTGSGLGGLTPIDPSIGGGDVINGGADNDRIHGQVGADTVHGNDGDDRVTGDEVGNPPGGDDLLFGDAGEDWVAGGPGDDDVIGGGDGADGDHLFGDDGFDFILGDDGSVNRTGLRDNHVVTFSGGGTRGDDLHGGADRDHLFGQGNSEAGAVDEVFGDGGGDDVYGDAPDPVFDTSDGMDVVHGNVGMDLVVGGNGADDVFGDAQDDHLIGGYPSAEGNDDGVRADTFGDHMFGGSGDDKMAGDDALISPLGIVTLLAESSQGQADLLFGEADDDAMYGELGDDDIFGSTGIDHAEGNAGDDDIFGEADDDDLIGGTTEASDTALGLGLNGGQPDGSDNIVGGDGHDALLGDNGQVIRTGETRPDGAPERTITLWDLDSTDLTLSGEEDLQGNAGNDDLYGGAEHDVISAHDGDDHGEGNNGGDDLVGGAGQDDLIGGTSGEVDEDGDPLVGGNHPDLDDTIDGGDGAGGVTEDDHDVACGDNCSIRRFAPTSGDGWARDDLDETRGIVDVIRRQIQLYDIGEVGAPAAAGTNAADTVRGEDDHDRLYGQGGDDTLEGGPVDDYVEGNDGHETIHGQGGQDDIVGGTGRTISDDPSTAKDGRLDTNDDLFGGDGAGGVTEDDFDMLMGDNATVLRGSPFPNPDPGSAWQFNTFNASVIRAAFLYDVGVSGAPVPAETNGADVIHGEANDDVAYGQGDGDTEVGAGGDDYLEGNEGADTIQGQDGNDDIIGGTGRINADPPTGVDGRLDAGETLSGGPGFDVMTGDNAIIRRVLDGNGAWLQNTFNEGVQHERIQLLDIASLTNPNVPTDVSGGDVMEGNEHDDLMYGQGNGAGVPDNMKGNDGDDYMEGNAGSDLMEGNADQDDMIGGTGRVNQDPPAGTPGRFDDGDRMFGGAAHDVMTGDNATVTRPLTPLPAGEWMTLSYGHLVDSPDPDDEFHDQAVTGSFTRFQRQIGMIDTDLTTVGAVSGSDLVNGNDGDDELFGQFDDSDGNGIGDDANVPVLCDGVTPPTVDDPDIAGPDATPVAIEGDLLCGEAGEDAIMGDQATIVDVAETGSAATTVSHNGAPFIREPVRPAGQLTRQVTLTQIAFGGDDVALGGMDHDSIHTGAGGDLANGGDYVNPQADVAFDIIFAGDGVDAAWGGPGHDHLWGGYEGDFLDVVPRANAQFPPNGDPLAWFLFAADDPDTVGNPTTPFGEGYDGYQGLDIVYGGWAQDALQANEGGNGPVPGDRLIDWVGAYNAYYVCPPTFGEHITTRQQSPSMRTFLIALAGHDGATTVGTGTRTTSSGFDELALVYNTDISQNSNPAHPDTPGHFTCE